MNDPQDRSVDLPLEQAKKRLKGLVITMDEPFQQVTRHLIWHRFLQCLIAPSKEGCLNLQSTPCFHLGYGFSLRCR
jgi:hypothetical protein